MYDVLLKRLVDRAFMICQINKHSLDCKIAWDQVDDVIKSKRMKKPPPQKPADRDAELSIREYDI